MIALETVVPTYQDWRAMQHWEQASASLIRVASLANDTLASYRYSVGGKDYQNDRVYVAPVKDNIGSYHRRLYQRLQAMQRNGQATPIWINPNDPAQSIIDREMRWGFFALMAGFCSVFMVIGLLICYASLKTPSALPPRLSKPSLIALRRQWKKQQQQSADHSRINFLDFVRQQAGQCNQSAAPDSAQDRQHTADSSPWLENKAWRDNRIRSGAKTGLYAMWAFAAVWCAVSSPLLFVLEDEIDKANHAALIGLIFPLIGLFLLAKAWQMTREWQRYGVIELELDPFPGSIGGHVGGRLMLDKVSDFRTPYKVELECVHSYISGSGKSRSRRETIRWAEQGSAKAEPAGHGVQLAFRFDVPDDLPETDMAQKGAYIFWRLRLSAELAGVGLNRHYTIPVFKTRTQSRFIRHDNSARAAAIRKEKAQVTHAAISRGEFASTPLASAFRYKNLGNRQVFYYPMFRNRLLTLIAVIFTGGFNFATYMINHSFGNNGIMGIVMLIFSLPFALVGMFATLAAVYLPLNNLTVTLTGSHITALRRLIILPIQYHTLQSRDIQHIEIKSSGSTGQGARQIKHFKLLAQGKNPTRITIAEDIDGEDLALQLKEYICRRLGIDV